MRFEPLLADRSTWRADPCSVAKVLDLFSTKTTFLVIRECFYGTTRFEDFVSRIGVSAPAVSRALRQLETESVVVRTPYRDAGARERDEYRLTPAGQDLLPVLMSLVQWGDRHVQPDGPPLSFFAAESGAPVEVIVTASAAERLGPDDIEIRATRHRR